MSDEIQTLTEACLALDGAVGRKSLGLSLRRYEAGTWRAGLHETIWANGDDMSDALAGLYHQLYDEAEHLRDDLQAGVDRYQAALDWKVPEWVGKKQR